MPTDVPVGVTTEVVAALGRRLSARSVLASTLLGTEPPRLPVSRLVRAGELFGLAPGTVRTALSRMVSAGEASRDADGWYELRGPLLERQAAQRTGRDAAVGDWSGRWRQAVVPGGARSGGERAELRRAMRRLRLGELREGVWLRPDNLDPGRFPSARAVVDAQCHWFDVAPDHDEELTGSLWDLTSWSTVADGLRRGMAGLVDRLEDGDADALRPGFELSAAVLRHVAADPLLPRELWPRHWPGPALRADYDRYDRAYRQLLGAWFRDDDGTRPPR
jgi:phenylacetic acid degradation operon negative regulatory protein